MDKFIRKLQNKSEPERRRILWGTSISLTAIIVFFWAISIFGGQQEAIVQSAKVETSQFSILKSNISNAYAGFKQTLDESFTKATTTNNNETR